MRKAEWVEMELHSGVRNKEWGQSESEKDLLFIVFKIKKNFFIEV